LGFSCPPPSVNVAIRSQGTTGQSPMEVRRWFALANQGENAKRRQGKT